MTFEIVDGKWRIFEGGAARYAVPAGVERSGYA